MKSWRFFTEGGDVVTTGAKELVGQPTPVMCICGLLGNGLAKTKLVWSKKLNDHVAASWMGILVCQASTLTTLEENKKRISNFAC